MLSGKELRASWDVGNSFLSFLKFSFFVGLSSLLKPLGFWGLGLPVEVCSLECNNNNNNNSKRENCCLCTKDVICQSEKVHFCSMRCVMQHVSG